jgi:PII-like signaling protein
VDREPAVTGHLKLTTYLGERQRSGSEFVAEAMLDLFTERSVASSIMLRGVTGFGSRHVLRTDESLSLSEDPPITIAALDTDDVIAAVAGDVAALLPQGLITVERARSVEEPQDIPADAGSVRITVGLGRNRRIGHAPAFAAVCDLFHRHHFAGATALLGVDGTLDGHRRRAHFFSRNRDVPLVIIAVGTAEQARAALPGLQAIPIHPLVTAERIVVCKRDGVFLQRPPALPAADSRGRPLWQKLMIHTSEATRHDGQPIHRAIVRQLRQQRAAMGATVLRGVWGFHGDQAPHGDRFIQWGRQVAVTTTIIDTPENIARSFELVDDLTAEHGLVTCETVPALLALGGPQSRGGLELAVYP